MTHTVGDRANAQYFIDQLQYSTIVYHKKKRLYKNFHKIVLYHYTGGIGFKIEYDTLIGSDR